MATRHRLQRRPARRRRATSPQSGFAWLHVVDLDGAFAGTLGQRRGGARRSRRAVDLRIQLGGGIRDRAAIDAWLDLGIDRVVLGTVGAARSRRWCGAPPPIIPAASSSASTRATAGSRSRAGPRPATIGARRPGAALRRCRRRRDRLHRHRARRRAGRRRCRGDRRRSPASSACRSSPRAAIAVARRHRRAQGARGRDGIAGAICGRALYDGRIDPQAALRLSPTEAVRC